MLNCFVYKLYTNYHSDTNVDTHDGGMNTKCLL